MKGESFKEFYARHQQAKLKLREAVDNVPRVRTNYRLTKYCRFPVFESFDSDEKVYVSFKPKDEVQILWEHVNEKDAYPTPKSIYILDEWGNEKEVFPCWNNKKMQKWVENSTIES
jgi:hypothetical protein